MQAVLVDAEARGVVAERGEVVGRERREREADDERGLRHHILQLVVKVLQRAKLDLDAAHAVLVLERVDVSAEHPSRGSERDEGHQLRFSATKATPVSDAANLPLV